MRLPTRKRPGLGGTGARNDTKADPEKYNAAKPLIQRLNWAIRQLIKHSDRIVLIGLVLRANAAGECWPAMATLAKDTSTGLRTVERSIGTLSQLGLISITRKPIQKKGKSGCRNHYRLELQANATKPPMVAYRSNLAKPHPLADWNAPTNPPVLQEQPANGGDVTVQGTTLRIPQREGSTTRGVAESLAVAVHGGRIR
jgi:GntR family transcriptional regulator